MNQSSAVHRSIVAIPLAFYGYALQKAWIEIDPAPAVGGFGDVVLGGLGVFTPFFAIVLAILFYRWNTWRLRLTVLACGMVLQVVSTALLILQPTLAGMSLVPFAIATQSLSSVAVSALWVDLYAGLGPVRAAFAVATSNLLSIVLIFLLEANDPNRLALSATVIPFVASVCYCLAAKPQFSNAQTLSPQPRLILPYRAIAFIAAYSFAYGVMSAFGFTTNSSYAIMLPAGIVVLLVTLNARKFNLSLLFRVAFALMAGGFLLVAIIPGTLGGASAIMLDTGFTSMELLLLLIVYTLAYNTKASAIWLFGILSATQFIAHMLGANLGDGVNAAPGSFEYAVLEAIALAFVALASFMLMSEKSLFAFWEGGRAVAEAAGKSSDDYLKARIEFLGATYALTEREREMVTLLAQGKSNNEIALESFISAGTVKVHLHNIYRKMGIHSRKELMALVEEKG